MKFTVFKSVFAKKQIIFREKNSRDNIKSCQKWLDSVILRLAYDLSDKYNKLIPQWRRDKKLYNFFLDKKKGWSPSSGATQNRKAFSQTSMRSSSRRTQWIFFNIVSISVPNCPLTVMDLSKKYPNKSPPISKRTLDTLFQEDSWSGAEKK